MEIKWEYPKMKYGFNPPAVYRFDFDNGYYYIGSSEKLKTRLSTWKTNLKRDVFQNKVLAEAIKDATKVKVSILEMPPKEILKERETYYLVTNFSDSFLLNQTPSGYTNEGRKPLPEQFRKPKKEKQPYVRRGKFKPDRNYVWVYSKPIVQLSLDGIFIRSHKSIADAARFIQVNVSVLKEHLKRERVYGVRGYIFREIGGIEDFELIKTKHKVKKVNLAHNGSKIVLDLNTGVFYYSGREAAIASGIKEKQLYKMLSGEINNKTQYRYA